MPARIPVALLALIAVPLALGAPVPDEARPSAAAREIHPNPCPPGTVATAQTGLDGGPGCRARGERESPGERLAARAAGVGRVQGVSGDERLAAVAAYRAMLRDAEARRKTGGESSYRTASGATVPDSANTWRNIGPRPIRVDGVAFPSVDGYGVDQASGRVTAVEVDPRDATGNTVYIGAAAGGVWRTRDGGVTWVPVADALPTLAIGDVAIDPTNGWLHVGTGEGNTGGNNYSGAGVYRSKDGGATWTRGPGVPADLVTSTVEVSGPNVFVATSGGLYRSTNRGDSFALVPLPTGGTGPSDKAFGNFVTDVRVQPGSPETVTAAVGWRSGGTKPAPGLYRSTDAGATFTKLAATGFGAASTSSDPIGRISLAYADGPEQDHDILWAVVQDAGRLINENTPLPLPLPGQAAPYVNDSNLNGVYRSGDNGATWTLKATQRNLAAAPGTGLGYQVPSTYAPGIQAWYNQYVVVDPADPAAERVIVGLEELYQTTANANGPGVAQWTTAARYWDACLQVVIQLNCEDLGVPGYEDRTVHSDHHAGAYALLPDGGARFYSGGDGGVWKQDVTPLAGLRQDSWTPVNDTLSISQPYYAAISRDGVVYAGLQDNGQVKVKDGVTNEIYGGDGFDTAVDPNDSDITYEEYANGALRVSQDGGVSWSGVISPTGATGMRFSTPYEMDPRNPDHLVYGANQVWETVEGSGTGPGSWVNVFTLTDADVSPNAATTAVDVDGTAAYAAWCGLPPAPPAGASACNIVTKDGNYDPSLFVRGLATNVKPGCARAEASTECWHHAAGAGLPNRFISSVTIDPLDPETVYVTVQGYARRWTYDPKRLPPGVVFKSTDAGETFTDISGNLPKTFGTDLEVQGGRLILSTDVGVFSTASETSTEWVPFGKALPAVPAVDLSVDPQGKTLLLATHGRGLYTLSLTGAAGAPLPPPVVKKPVAGPKPPKRGSPLPATGAPGWVLAAPIATAAALALRHRSRRARRAEIG
ncbi:MAG TPA: hypothetical protein VNA12_08590 [Mycobacteriales bacterium]|nr:hypothetical protein [Mycobacteriales bacterium]